MRILLNYTLRKDTWFVHAVTGDAGIPISPILPVRDQAMLIRLLRYVGAGDSANEEVNVDIARWSSGSTWIDLAPGRRNLLRIRLPWSGLAG
jgi:hypothetical protein